MKSKFGLLVLVCTLAGCHSAPKEEDAAAEPVVSVETVQAVSRVMREQVEVQGSFVPSQGGAAKLTPMASGRLTQVLVKEGDTVSAGQLLAMVDTHVQASQQASAAAAAQAAQAQVSQSKLSYEAVVADQTANVQNAQLALDAAKLDRDSAVTQAQIAYQSALEDVARAKSQSEQAIVQARVARDHAQSDYDRDRKLADAGFVSKKDLEASKAALDTAESVLQAAQTAGPTDIKSAELKAAASRDILANAKASGAKKVVQAESALRQAQKAQLAVAAKRQEVTTNQSLAQQKQADLAAAAATTSQGEIRAPFAGRVVRRNLGRGDFADTTTPVLEIVGSGSRPDFVGTLPAADAGRIKVGMQAIVDGVEGRVASVSPADPQTGLASIRVVGNFTASLGAFSSGQVVVASHWKAIAVPKDAIVDRDGKPVVFKIEGDTAKMAEVKTRAEDGGFIEVVSGVSVGDKLVKVGQYELTDGAKVKVGS